MEPEPIGIVRPMPMIRIDTNIDGIRRYVIIDGVIRDVYSRGGGAIWYYADHINRQWIDLDPNVQIMEYN